MPPLPRLHSIVHSTWTEEVHASHSYSCWLSSNLLTIDLLSQTYFFCQPYMTWPSSVLSSRKVVDRIMGICRQDEQNHVKIVITCAH